MSNHERQPEVEIVTKLPETDAAIDVANAKLKTEQIKSVVQLQQQIRSMQLYCNCNNR